MLIKNQGRKTLQALYSLVPNYILFIKIKFLAIMFKSNCCLLFCFLERIYFNAPIARHLQNWNSKLETIPGSESFFSWYMILLSLNFKNVIPDIDILYRSQYAVLFIFLTNKRVTYNFESLEIYQNWKHEPINSFLNFWNIGTFVVT